jgi:hypothetical protein
MLLTLILLTRAFSSIVLAAKAVVLNLLCRRAHGIVGSSSTGPLSSIWGVPGSQSITAYISDDLRVPCSASRWTTRYCRRYAQAYDRSRLHEQTTNPARANRQARDEAAIV